jgi:hypothetical protein
MTNRSRPSQAIQNALLQGQTVTAVQAGMEFGYWRLAALIHRLRRRGWPIESHQDNRNGLAHYRLPVGWHPHNRKQETL